MARMPGAEWLGEQSPRNTMDRYDIVCVHTIVGYAPAHAAHFSVKADGTILQSRDTAYQSAANLYGNPRVIAIENEDHGAAFGAWTGSSVPALTDAQVEANGRILAWANEVHGIPLQLCPDSRPGSRGLAYHRQGIDGNFGSYQFPGRVSGGEVWTLTPGKVCPGDRRIAQLPEILAFARTQGDDMFDDKDRANLVETTKNVAQLEQRFSEFRKQIRDRDAKLRADVLAELDQLGESGATKEQVRRLRAQVSALTVADDVEP